MRRPTLSSCPFTTLLLIPLILPRLQPSYKPQFSQNAKVSATKGARRAQSSHKPLKNSRLHLTHLCIFSGNGHNPVLPQKMRAHALASKTPMITATFGQPRRASFVADPAPAPFATLPLISHPTDTPGKPTADNRQLAEPCRSFAYNLTPVAARPAWPTTPFFGVITRCQRV